MRYARDEAPQFRVSLCLLMLAGASIFLHAETAFAGDKVGKLLSAAPLASPARPVTEAIASNRFEISSYELSKPGQPEQDSHSYRRQLVNALKKRGGLVSLVLESDEDMVKTEQRDCKGKSCDVVGVTETLVEGRMILTLNIDSTPESHSKLHKARFSEPHHCNPNNCSEENCRADLIEEIVEELVALDKDHKGSR